MITKSDVSGVKIMRLTLGLIFVASAFSSSSAQGTPPHPIARYIDDHTLVSPEDLRGQEKKVQKHGVPCDAISDLWVTVEGSEGRYLLTYEKMLEVYSADNMSCNETKTPDIKTKFDISFSPSRNTRVVDFQGTLSTTCEDEKCAPKRVRSISGTITQIDENRFKIAFSGGDLSENVELHPLKSK
jgi:hypothetical protein